MYAVEHIGGVRGFSGTRDAGLSPGGATDVDPDPEDPHAVDEQLTAILEVIRSWDWRAGIFADDGMRHGEVESTGRHALVEPSNRATPNVEPPSVTPTPLLATAAAAEMSAGPTLPTAPTSPVPEPTVAPAAPAPPQFFCRASHSSDSDLGSSSSFPVCIHVHVQRSGLGRSCATGDCYAAGDRRGRVGDRCSGRRRGRAHAIKRHRTPAAHRNRSGGAWRARCCWAPPSS